MSPTKWIEEVNAIGIVNYGKGAAPTMSGDDTDTVGAVAGGLAGLYYGYDSIPVEWIDVIQKKEWIEELLEGLQ
jgi:ADP-ribosylglycohydrolase